MIFHLIVKKILALLKYLSNRIHYLSNMINFIVMLQKLKLSMSMINFKIVHVDHINNLWVTFLIIIDEGNGYCHRTSFQL